jgi:hypothetical protein
VCFTAGNKGIVLKKCIFKSSISMSQTKEILVIERACLSSSCKHFWGKNPVKSLLISTLYKVIYYNETFLQGSTKPLFTSQNGVETS